MYTVCLFGHTYCSRGVFMQNKKQKSKQKFIVYFKSVVVTFLAIILIAIGYFAAVFLFGVN